jgi:uncharacterized protein (DUF1015 family)
VVDFQPFRGLRYTPAAGDLSDLISPPYDVLSPAQVEELKAHSPYNVVRLEHPSVALGDAGQPYQLAAELLADWRTNAIVRRDGSPAYYLHEQHFAEDGRPKRRVVVYGRLKLSDWENGDVLPHEYTMAGPKQDRLKLMRALRANISPLYLLYDDPEGHVQSLLGRAGEYSVLAEAHADGERHELKALVDPVVVETLRAQFAARRLYMADGHHRYETALAFRDEDGSEASKFVMVGLTAGDDPGLSIHATHRLLATELVPEDAHGRLHDHFAVIPASRDELGITLAGPNLAIGVAGLDGPPSLHLLSPRDAARLLERVTGEVQGEWKALDVNVLQQVVLGQLFGLDPNQPNQPGLSYVHSIDEALEAVRDGIAALAFLLRPVTPQQLFRVSDLGVRLPQKTTYFYPKLPTGLVINLID